MIKLLVRISCYLSLLIPFSCQQTQQAAMEERVPGLGQDSLQSLPNEHISKPKPVSQLEEAMIAAGLVNIHSLDTSILVDLKYSTTDNFVGVDVYGDLENAYLQPEVASKLVTAQKLLNDEYPDYHLLVYDAARPRSVQQILWDTLNKPHNIKHFYVANPEEGSIHNFGSAVDLTIANAQMEALDMGTHYDFFGEMAYPSKEPELLASGQLTEKHISNREILRSVMRRAGFTPITTEWWHFNALSRARAAETYDIIE